MTSKILSVSSDFVISGRVGRGGGLWLTWMISAPSLTSGSVNTWPGVGGRVSSEIHQGEGGTGKSASLFPLGPSCSLNVLFIFVLILVDTQCLLFE